MPASLPPGRVCSSISRATSPGSFRGNQWPPLITCTLRFGAQRATSVCSGVVTNGVAVRRNRQHRYVGTPLLRAGAAAG